MIPELKFILFSKIVKTHSDQFRKGETKIQFCDYGKQLCKLIHQKLESLNQNKTKVNHFQDLKIETQ